MIRHDLRFFALAMAVIFVSLPAGADTMVTAQQSPVDNSQPVPVANAKLYRVDDGVFELREGKSVDLTDRAMLLTFRKTGEEFGAVCAQLVLAGREFCMRIGQQWNLQQDFNAVFHDKERCFLNVFEINAPKGAAATALLRFYCL